MSTGSCALGGLHISALEARVRCEVSLAAGAGTGGPGGPGERESARLQQVGDLQLLKFVAALLHALREQRLDERQQRGCYCKGAQQHKVRREHRVDQVLRQVLEQHEEGDEHGAAYERELHSVLTARVRRASERAAAAAECGRLGTSERPPRGERSASPAHTPLISADGVTGAARSPPTFLLMLWSGGSGFTERQQPTYTHSAAVVTILTSVGSTQDLLVSKGSSVTAARSR